MRAARCTRPRTSPRTRAGLRDAALTRAGDRGGATGALELIADHVTVDVDVDVLDPAFAPGTGTPEAGGLTSHELLAIVRGLGEAGVDVAAADVVEVAPAYDHGQITAIAAANVAYDLFTLLAARARRPGAGSAEIPA